jgi:NAD(P)-dependent dehydrogenase (short-subunit alcohol dehydrogenase family)
LPFLEIKFQSFPSNNLQWAARKWLPRKSDLNAASTATTKGETNMTTKQKTIIVTGASQGIGAAVANLFLSRGYNVVGNSRKISHQNELQRSEKLALVDGDIGLASTAEMIVATAVKRFGSVDALVNNAGIFFAKPFTEYTAEDFRALSSTNLYGFIHTTQLAVKQMLAQKNGGSVVSITTSIVDHPLAALTASFPMITKGGIDAISRSLAMEYAPQGLRVNVVAPGIVDTPLHKNNPKEFLRTLSPLGRIADAKDIAEAVFYLTEASQVTGEVLHVDGGAHLGRW